MDDSNDYSITWAYIVKKMEEEYDIGPKSERLFAFADLVRYMNYIWGDYCNEKYEKEKEETYKWTIAT